MSSQDKHSSEIDKRILETVQHLLAKASSANFTMDELAKESGISRATIYRRMGSREALLKRLAEEHNMEIEELDAPGIRERILIATRKALSKAGSINFTIEEVAKQANVGVATIYRHFGSKTALLQAFSSVIHPRKAAIQLLDQTTGDLEKDLLHFATTALNFMYTNRDLASFYFSSDTNFQDVFQSLRGDKNRTIDTLSIYFKDQIAAEKIPPSDAFNLATAFLGMIIGFAFIKPSYTDEIDEPDQVAQTIVQIFLSGIHTKD